MSQDVMNCPACARRTPSARGVCLYCGAHLPVTKIESAPPQRVIDEFERAFNTVLDPTPVGDVDRVEAAFAAALKIEQEEARAYLSAGKRVPLARSHTRQEAELIAALIRDCGLGAVVVADEDLRLDSELARARRIVEAEGRLEVSTASGVMRLASTDIRLLVLGALRNTRVDYIESAAGKSDQSNKVIDSSEYRSEETLVDLYTGSLETSFRLKADAFDYSGLVSPLSFRAEENFQRAMARLRAIAPGALIDEDFARMRKLLSRAWPDRSKTEARGIRRTGVSRKAVAQSSVISGNREQFDRYSRLMFLSL